MYRIFIFLTLAFLAVSCPVSGQQFCDSVKVTDVYGNENPVINCSYPLADNCLTLQVSYPTFYETTSYKVSSEDYTPYGPFNSGTPLHANADDLFFTSIAIPFSFCYFGKNYTEVIVGSNGVLTFDRSQLGKVNYPNVEDANPSITLPVNSIFGVFSDLVFSKNDDSEVYYSIIGKAPCRKLVVNFYKGRVLGCDQTITSQIVLSEGSNELEVFIENKPLLCAGAKFKNSLVGIINSTATVGYSPIGRNSGIWEAEHEAWKFKPDGKPVVSSIKWYNSNNTNVGTGASVKVCSDINQIYTAKVSYPLCGNLNYVLEDSSAVTFAADYPLPKNATEIFCGSTSININLTDYRADLTPQNVDDFIFSFHNTLAEAQTGTNPQPINFILDDNKIFFVRIQNPADPNCYRVAVLNLTLISKSLLTSSVEICDINNDGVENNYNLSLFNNLLFASPINGTIHYFGSQSDAQNNNNELVAADLVDLLQFYVSYQTETCSQIFGPVTVHFKPSPVVNSPIDFSFESCDFLGDYIEPFNFKEIIGPLVTSDPLLNLSFYATYEEAYSDVGSILTTVKEGHYQIFVRVEEPGGCFSIATVNLIITLNRIEAKDDTEYICFDGVQDVAVDLNDYAPGMLLQSPVGITTSFFSSVKDAEIGENPISNNQIITDNGDLVTKVYFVKFSDGAGCYSVKSLNINLIHVVIKESKFDVCDFDNDGVEKIMLSTLSSRIIGTQKATVSYFLNIKDAQSNTNAITTYTIPNTAKIFVRIKSYGCSEIFEIEINLVSTPLVKEEVTVVLEAVCDNNNDGLEPVDLTKYQTEIYTGTESVSFKYYSAYNPVNHSLTGPIATPTGFVIPKNKTVFVKVSFAGGCYSVSALNITLNFLPVIVLNNAELKKCDYDFNLNESFNLEDAIPQLFVENENSLALADLRITFYKTESAANAGATATQISSPVVTINSRTIVWVRFTSKSIGCYSVASIELHTYLPPKGMNTIIKDLCDENLDGLAEVDLTQYTDRMVYTPDSENRFTFFLTKEEADANTNPILHPEKFTFNPALGRVWVRIENIPGCFDTASVDLQLGKKITFNNDGPFTLKVCDTKNDGIENVDLTQFENIIYGNSARFDYYPTLLDLNNNTNRITTPESYLLDENLKANKIYVKLSAGSFCPAKVQIDITLNKTPVVTLPDYYFCPGGSVSIQPDFADQNIVGYEWRDPTGKIISTVDQLTHVTEVGLYHLTVTSSNGCKGSTDFNIQFYEVPVITNLIANSNSYTVIATGTKKIIYSVDGINYQSGNVFYNLPYGIITFYVKFEDSDCDPQTKRGLVLNIKNAFSPNDDGINDTWIIDDLNVFDGKKANLKVFNRFKEKIYEQESATRLEWNGKTLGRVVPTDSYWYVLTLADGRIFTGWVLLKNRN